MFSFVEHAAYNHKMGSGNTWFARNVPAIMIDPSIANMLQNPSRKQDIIHIGSRTESGYNGKKRDWLVGNSTTYGVPFSLGARLATSLVRFGVP